MMSVSTEDQKFDRLVQALAPQSKLLRTWPLKGGISAEMTALEITLTDGQTKTVIVRRPGDQQLRQNPNTAANEFRLLQITWSSGLATPMPYLFDESGEIFSTPYVVIEYIAGAMEFSPSNLARYILQLAMHLARIHQMPCSPLELSFLPTRANGCAETFGKRPTTVDPSLEEGRIRQTLEAAWPLAQRNASVLLHGDFWPGNVLWRDGQLVAVVDWEDATLGDPLADVAITRLDVLCIFGIAAMQDFTQHYQALVPVDYSHLPYWDLCAALRLARLAGSDLAAWAAFFPPFGRHDITEQTIRDHYRFFITQAFEKIAVLFEEKGSC